MNDLDKLLSRQQHNNNIDNYFLIVSNSWNKFPFFYDESSILWLWDDKNKKYFMCDLIDIFNKLIFENVFTPDEILNNNKNREIIIAIKMVGRLKRPKDAPQKWVQFKGMAYSLSSKKQYEVQPNYFFTNPIPWELGDSCDTPVMDKLFNEWVGSKYAQTLYEILAYCTYSGYPIQVIICLCGHGRNGKSSFLKILEKFIGQSNITSTDLGLLAGHNRSRFEVTRLYKRLVCLVGETDFGRLSQSSILKRLTGGDLINFEVKNKTPFEAHNYAKMIIATNSLPTSEDNSEGFYRRWLIIDFPNEFPEGGDIVATIPDVEYSNLARKCTQLLPELLKRNFFVNTGSIQERKDKYVLSSNPINLFMDIACNKGDNLFCQYGHLYLAYKRFLFLLKKRRVQRKEFKEAIEEEGIFIDKTSKEIFEGGVNNWKSTWWAVGLELKPNWEDGLKELGTSKIGVLGGNVKPVSPDNPKKPILEALESICVPDKSGDWLFYKGEPKKDKAYFLRLLKEFPERDNAVWFDENFDAELILRLKAEGVIAEFKKGTYSLVE